MALESVEVDRTTTDHEQTDLMFVRRPKEAEDLLIEPHRPSSCG